MTIDEAIRNCEEVAEKNEVQADKIGRQFIGSVMDKRATDCRECAADHRQLAEWLTDYKELKNSISALKLSNMKEALALIRTLKAELNEAKRLLRLAVEDLNATVAKVYNGDVICECCEWKSQIGECRCPDTGGCDTDYRWRYADEAKKLLNDE